MANYSYNGVILPQLPEWDKTSAPYAIIRRYTATDGSAHYHLYISHKPLTVYGRTYSIRGGYVPCYCKEDDEAWEIREYTTDTIAFTSFTAVWANYTVSGVITASEPVLVGGANETVDIKPVYKYVDGSFVKQIAYERQSGEWVLISSANDESMAAYYSALSST